MTRKPAHRRRAFTLGALIIVAALTATTKAFAGCAGPGHRDGTDEASLEKAAAILATNGIAVGRDYATLRFVPYASGAGMIEVRRLQQGLPMFGDELAFHFDSQQRLKLDSSNRPLVGGTFASKAVPADLDPRPTVNASAAKTALAQRARTRIRVDRRGRPSGTTSGPDYSDRLDELDAQLGIHEGNLAWLVCARDSGYPYAFISATDGQVLFFDSGIRF